MENFNFSEAERIRYGRFPVLDTVLYRWTRKIEETLFEHSQMELYAGCSVVEEMKFSAFYGAINTPRPIYMVGVEPLPGEALLVLDNRFVQLGLRRGATDKTQKYTLDQTNHRRLQKLVQKMTADFEQSWQDVLPVQVQLKKLTTYPFRARILTAYEACLVVHVHLSGANFSSRMTWCFPRVMLEPALAVLRGRRVIPSQFPQRVEATPPDGMAFLGQTRFDVRVRLGQLNLLQAPQGLRPGSILPLLESQSATLAVNGKPLLAGQLGELQGGYAVKITNAHSSPTPAPTPIGVGAPVFRSIRWPLVGDGR